MKIKLIKFKQDLISPSRAHYNDAGIDCYAQEDVALPGMSLFVTQTPANTKVTIPSDDKEFVPAAIPTMVSLGFGLEVPDGYMATIRPRSSMNAKGIITQIGTIDSGYRGEIKAIFMNLSPNDLTFKKGDKICQIVIEPVILADFEENLVNDRGTGGFGSTDVKSAPQVVTEPKVVTSMPTEDISKKKGK